ncbi:MAG: glycoside hydrolase [Verrucomicrobia bacterium]|nr:glycoside hydrolase [Verrucomicrobiota bacterium]
MNSRSALLTALTAALVAAATLTTHAQTWQDVDNFQFIPGLRAYGSDIGTDSSGVLYAVGGGNTDASGDYRAALLNVSHDQGANWTMLNQAHEPGWTWGHYRAVAVSGSRLFVGGNGRYTDSTGEQGISWLIRESVDEGQTWTTTDSLLGDYSGCADIAIHPGTGDVYAGGSSGTVGGIIRKRAAGPGQQFTTVYAAGPGDIGSAWSMTFHPNGSVIVAGNKVNATTHAMSWIVLRSVSGDAGTWQPVDTFRTTEWTGISAGGCLVTDDGTIYVSGWAYNSKTRKNHWVVRASTDGGNTWAISDNFNYGGNTPYVFEMSQDPAGNFYVCGQAANSSGKLYWIVRKGTPTTTRVKQGKKYVYVTKIVWTTSDAYQFAPGKEAMALGITVDDSGNIFASGRAQDATGVEHLIVRKLAP